MMTLRIFHHRPIPTVEITITTPPQRIVARVYDRWRQAFVEQTIIARESTHCFELETLDTISVGGC